MILRTSRADQGFTTGEWRVLAQALDFRDLEVADLMRPFNEAVTLSEDDGVEASLEKIARHRFSRYPYLGADGRSRAWCTSRTSSSPCSGSRTWRASTDSCGRPRWSRPDWRRRSCSGAFAWGAHFAVVAYENAHPIGYITLDNLLGALVGEFRDEFRQAQDEWSKLDDGSLIGKGSLPIFTLERALGIDIEESGVDSIGGLIMPQLGDVPEEGQRIRFTGFDAVMKKMNGPRIVLVRVIPRGDADD